MAAMSKHVPDGYRIDKVHSGMRAWGELVISYDGGGIKGFSSLQILEELMKYINIIETELAKSPNHGIGPLSAPLKSKDYFDYSMGTSTGGLIALLTGRLLQPPGNCRRMYERLVGIIFRKRRWYQRWRLFSNKYSAEVFEEAVKDVLKDRCGSEGRDGVVPMVPTKAKGVRPHRAGVFAVARDPQNGDYAYLFRTYPFDHSCLSQQSATAGVDEILNAGENPVNIHEAARATAAAPGYFNDVEIRGRRYMDGGLQNNNPTGKAWKEAEILHRGRPQEQQNNSPKSRIGMVVSIGTGKKGAKSAFSRGRPIGDWLSLLNVAKRSVTDTEAAHNFALQRAIDTKTPYFRFNVDHGMEHIAMDDCKQTTLDAIARATHEYLEQPWVQQMLQQCAEIAVAHRHGRIRQLHGLQYPAQTQHSISTRASTRQLGHDQVPLNGWPVNGATVEAESRRFERDYSRVTTDSTNQDLPPPDGETRRSKQPTRRSTEAAELAAQMTAMPTYPEMAGDRVDYRYEMDAASSPPPPLRSARTMPPDVENRNTPRER